ncbi:CoA transferase subunit A [Vallitalea okinawensis]|uniref:CoA transferase subunit A n=1 Tax=Vallitalea okinawensis TaxID=2078660 RepID=UPI000CFDFF45|nr:3-oxoacid CoA-transferase subunit A [Vallitalea okinawensis]
MNKQIDQGALKSLFKDDMTIMVGGFMATGSPEEVIDAIIESGVKGLTLIGNDTATATTGMGRLVASGQVKKVITSHIGLNHITIQKLNAGEIEVELVPQGTIIERIRAKGCGLGGILTPTGVGTVVEEGKEKLEVDGRTYLLEKPLSADLAIIRADKVDELGNCRFVGTTRNFNPIIAMAADTVICEAEEILTVGKIHPDDVMLPHIFIDHIIKGGKIYG